MINNLASSLVCHARCSEYFGSAVQDIISDRLVVENLTTQAEHALNMHKMHLERVNYLSENYAGASKETAERIQGEQEALSKKMDACLMHHEKTSIERFHKELDLAEKSLVYIGDFNMLMAECVVDIRRDMENAFSAKDAEKYRSIVLESIAIIRQKGGEFISKVRAKIKEFDLPDL